MSRAGASVYDASASVFGTSWDTMQGFTFDTIVQDVSSHINSLSWSVDGSQFLASAEDDSVTLASLDSVQKTWTCRGLYSRKHGAEQTKFLGRSNHMALALSKFERDLSSTVRFWDLRENRFLRVISFEAKVLRVNGIHTQANDKPHIMASTLDGRVLLYTFESEKPVACFKANLDDNRFGLTWHRSFVPVSAFDSGVESHTFALATGPQVVRLLDLRYIEQGEFLILSLHTAMGPTDWIRVSYCTVAKSRLQTLEFTPLTSNLLVSTAQGKLLLINSVDGSLLNEFKPPKWTGTGTMLCYHRNAKKSAPVCSLEFHTLGYGIPAVPTDESVVALGLWDAETQVGRVALWDFDSGKLSGTFGQFFDVPMFVKFHPQRAQLAVGDVMLTSWIRAQT